MKYRATSLCSRIARLRMLGLLLVIMLLVLPVVHFTGSRAAAASPVLDDGTGSDDPSASTIDVAASCTAVNLTKGPTLILTGSNTQMKIFWQWSSNTTFTVRWGTDTSYGKGKASVTANNATYHTYVYTISGLTPGTKYFYQVATGSQCASGTLRAPPAATAASVKFTAYGDTRTYGSVHNDIAGRVVSLFKADPAFQTLNIHVGDWVSSDSESAWTHEWFDPAYSNIRQQDASLADTGVRGNHEGGATLWKRYFPAPFVSGTLYHSLDYGPMHVALLDQYTSFAPGSAQYNWLKHDLATTTKPWKFVVFHEPGWSAKGRDSNNTNVPKYLQPLFVQYGVQIAFAGHNHYYARAQVGPVVHLTLGGGGAELHTPAVGQPNIIITKKAHSFGEFTIAGNTLTAKIVNSNGTTIDSFTITR